MGPKQKRPRSGRAGKRIQAVANVVGCEDMMAVEWQTTAENMIACGETCFGVLRVELVYKKVLRDLTTHPTYPGKIVLFWLTSRRCVQLEESL
jgi:hypothetical protein